MSEEKFAISKEDGLVQGSFSLPSGSLFAEYCMSLGLHQDETFDTSCVKVLKDSSDTTDSFITVATRTQGKRLAELCEVFLCLNAQIQRNFTFCILGHNIEKEAEQDILEIIESQPQWLKNKTQFVSVEGGSRSRPLNAALYLTKTEYITFLDDDDLVFANWLQLFHDAILNNNGSIIYSYVLTQKWSVLAKDGKQNRLIASGAPNAEYCKDYDTAEQIYTNHCPIMGLAYPMYIYKVFGIKFNEELSTTEDWDFLMRAASVCGVVTIPEATSLYRLWDNAENSQSLHKKQEWDANRLIIQKNLSNASYLLPKGAIGDFVNNKGRFGDKVCFSEANRMKLSYRNATGWHDEAIHPQNVQFDSYSQTNSVEFSGLDTLDSISEVDIFFRDQGLLTISELYVSVKIKGEASCDYGILDVHNSGIIYTDYATKEDKIAFLSSSPHLTISWGKESVVLESVMLSFVFENGVHDRLLTGTKIMVKIKQMIKKLYHAIKKLV